MKKRLVKVLVFITLALCAIFACAFIADAAEETTTHTIKYIKNGDVGHTDTAESGSRYTIRKNKLSATQTGKSFFGWYTEDGRFYGQDALGSFITIKSDMTFYEAYGIEVRNKEDFARYIAQKGPGNYVRLTADITVDKTLTLPVDGYVVLDLNGKTLTLNTEGNAFEGTNATIHIIDSSAAHVGKIVHNCSNEDTYVRNALFNYSPKSLNEDIEVKVFPPYGETPVTQITTNVGFFNIETDISESGYTVKFDMPCNLTASYMLHSKGLKDAVIDVTEKSRMNFNGARIFEDWGTNEGKVLTFNIDSGRFKISEKTQLANDQSRYNIYITGGSFDRDVADLFENGNYSFKLNSATSLYDFSACKHENQIIGMTVTCTTDGTITNQCEYCGFVEIKAQKKLGHITQTVLTKEASAGSATEEATKGYYTTSCLRCDYETYEYYYPNAKDVYVSVGFRDGRVVRVQASTLFGNNLETEIKSFSPASVEKAYDITREEIIYLELPLGVESVAGGTGIDGATWGIFQNNNYLETIKLPESMKTVKVYAFSYMTKLKSIEGLEHVSESFGEFCFAQNADSQLVIDHMEINAKHIGKNAFRNARMKTLKLGASVDKIYSGAFGLDDNGRSILVEMFIAENTEIDGLTAKGVTGAFSTLEGGQQFDGRSIVYVDHDKRTETIKPTCTQGGYDRNYCSRCQDEFITNETEPIDHSFTVEKRTESTCEGQGEIYNICSMCLEAREHVSWLPADPTNHVFTKKYYYNNDDERTINTCTEDYRIVNVCACEKVIDWMSAFENGGIHTATGEHEYDYTNIKETVPANCSTDGYMILDCLQCGEENIKKVIPATGNHTFELTEGVVTKKPTCTTPGEKTYYCKYCGIEKDTKGIIPVPSLEALNEDLEKHGKAEYHTFDDGVVTKEATETTAGAKLFTCKGCGKTYTEYTNPIGLEEQEEENAVWAIVLSIAAGVIVLALLGILLYFSLFKKNPARKRQFNLDDYSTKRE